LLQKAHQHVANQRKDFQHKLSTWLVQNFGVMAVEDLNIQGLSGGILAKAVQDVGWSSFLNMLTKLRTLVGSSSRLTRNTQVRNAPTATPWRRSRSQNESIAAIAV